MIFLRQARTHSRSFCAPPRRRANTATRHPLATNYNCEIVCHITYGVSKYSPSWTESISNTFIRLCVCSSHHMIIGTYDYYGRASAMPPAGGIPRRYGTLILYTWMFFLCQKMILKHEIMYGIWKVKCWEGAEKNFYQDFCTLLSLCVEFRFYEVFIDWTKTNLECNSNYSCLVKTLLIGDRKDYQTPLIFLVIREIRFGTHKWNFTSLILN